MKNRVALAPLTATLSLALLMAAGCGPAGGGDEEVVIEDGCGDDVCGFGEDEASCPDDCAISSGECGDGVCWEDEDAATCPSDCVTSTGSCGDGVCSMEEDPMSCGRDCSFDIGSECGDGVCDADEDEFDCPQDCASDGGPECGDGVCEGGESEGTCPSDCSASCSPDCAGKTCGPDGCGGTCGPCGSNQRCDAGTCRASVNIGGSCDLCDDTFDLTGKCFAAGDAVVDVCGGASSGAPSDIPWCRRGPEASSGYCTIRCSSASDCPDGYTCADTGAGATGCLK